MRLVPGARAPGGRYGVVRKLLVLTALLCWFLVEASQAQQRTLAPGARVRLDTTVVGSARSWVEGAWLDAALDTAVLLDTAGVRHALPFSRVRALQVYDGRRSHWLRGLTIGSLVGLGGGLLLHARACAGDGDRPACVSNGALAFGLLGTAVGGAIGAGIGANSRCDRWIDVTPPLVRVGIRW